MSLGRCPNGEGLRLAWVKGTTHNFKRDHAPSKGASIMPSAQLRLSVAVEHTLGKVRKQRRASGLEQVQDELGDHQFGLGFAGLRGGGRSGFGSSFGAFGFGRL